MSKRRCIGVDLHTDNFVVCYLERGKESVFLTYPLHEPGILEFISTLKKDDVVAIESVINAAFFKDKIRDYVKKVEVVASVKFKLISKSVKKTDKNDAELLAIYLSKELLPPARLRSEQSIQIESLFFIRKHLVATRTKLINKTHSNMFRHGHKIGKAKLKANNFEKNIFPHEWSDAMTYEFEFLYRNLENLKLEIKELEREIIKRGSELKGYDNLISIKGVGKLTAIIILITIDNIENFKNSRHLASYFGIVPQIRQSNDYNPRRPITKTGSKFARAALVQTTWVVIRFNENYNRRYQILKQRTGSPLIAVIACSRRLLVTMYHAIKNDWIYDDFSRNKYHVRKQG